MRESKIKNYQPKFKSPFYPWIQIIGSIGYICLIVMLGIVPLLITIGFMVFAFLWYIFYAKKRVLTKRSALIHIVERITAKEIRHDYLTNELKDILRERDNMIDDRFDEIIKNSIILDIDKKITAKELFSILSEKLSNKLRMDKNELNKLFLQREEESSTVISEGLAIPHIIIPGEKKFEIMVIRCKKGITFSKDKKPVHTIFNLVGSNDERHFHLQSLMYDAQIAKNENFLDYWLNALDTEELRDIIFCSKRKRI